MKRILKSSIAFLTLLAILASIFCFSASASATTTISCSAKSITVGETITFTVRMNADEDMLVVAYSIEYDSSVLEYTGGSAQGGAGSLKVIEMPSPYGKSASYSFTFKGIKAGTSTFAVKEAYYEGESDTVDATGSAVNVTVKDMTLSANANLKSLSLSSGKLSPAFSASKTEYSVKVPNSVSELKVYATPSDSAAKVSIDGNKNLKIGNNTVNITVTAQNGAQKQYTISVMRSETEEITDEEPDDETKDPLNVTIGETEYFIASDLTDITLFDGFIAEAAKFGEADIQVAIDQEGEYKIYFLKAADGDEYVPYTYDEKLMVFEKINYVVQGENYYIFAKIPEDLDMPEYLYSTVATINSESVECFASNKTEMVDFYYIYCFANGRYGIYRYDSRENVLQREPGISLVKAEEVEAQRNKNTISNIVSRFNNLTTNSKIVVIVAILVLVLALILLILAIIKIAKKKPDLDFDDDDDAFDDIEEIGSSFSLMKFEENSEEALNNFAENIDDEIIEESENDVEEDSEEE